MPTCQSQKQLCVVQDNPGGGGDKNLLIPMEIEPCSSHTSTNSILHCVNRPAKPLFFFLLEKPIAEGYSGQRGGLRA